MGEINSLMFPLTELHSSPELDIGTVYCPRGFNFEGNKYRYVKNVSGAVLAVGQVVTGIDAYEVGSITTVDGSKVVTGAATTFTAAMVGRTITIAGVKYIVEKFVSTTVLHLTKPWSGTGAAGILYVITASGEVSDVGGGEDNGVFEGIAISAIADDGFGLICVASQEGIFASVTAGVAAGDHLNIGLTLYLDAYVAADVDVPVGVALSAHAVGDTALVKLFDLTG